MFDGRVEVEVAVLLAEGVRVPTISKTLLEEEGAIGSDELLGGEPEETAD